MDKQYLVTERAHFMCPNMYFGILATIPKAFDSDKAQLTLNDLASAHPFLRSTIAYDTDDIRLYYHIHKESKIEVHTMPNVTDVSTNGPIWKHYKAIGMKEWNVFQNGLLKVFFYPSNENFQVLLIAHHLLGDGRAIQQLICEFADCYIEKKKPAYVEEHLIQSESDLPNGSQLPFTSSYIVKRANKQWKKEQHRVSYEAYATFSDNFALQQPIGYERRTLKEDEVKGMIQQCKEYEVSVNDFLMTNLFHAAKTKKIIMAFDIRSQLTCYQKGAMGNYASALGIIYNGKNKNFVKRVKEVHARIKASKENNKKLMLVLSCYLNMDPTLLDAAAISGMKGYSSKAAAFVGNGMFGMDKREGISITNLGSILNPNLLEATFIPPASPAAKYTVGVLTVNNRMNLCSSYYMSEVSSTEAKTYLEQITC